MLLWANKWIKKRCFAVRRSKVENRHLEMDAFRNSQPIQIEDKSGALKMQDRRMQDLKMRDQIAGHENAGPENGGPNCRA